MKGREPEWPNPMQIECGKLSKKLKNGLKTKHPTLPNHSNFQKCEFSVAPEIHFKHIFKIRGHLWVRPLWF